MLTRRFLAIFILLISALYLPWWVTVILSVIGFYFFQFFVEGVLIFFLMDLMYGVQEPHFLNFMFTMSLFGVVVFLVIEFLKKKILVS